MGWKIYKNDVMNWLSEQCDEHWVNMHVIGGYDAKPGFYNTLNKMDKTSNEKVVINAECL